MFPYEDSEIVSVRPYPEKRNHLNFVNISPTLVIDTSMERSSQVLTAWKPKYSNFFTKKVEIEFDMYFNLSSRSEITITL